MGEDDPGAVIGNNVNLTLTAAVGTDLLVTYQFGPLGTYTNDTPGAPSSLVVAFQGYGDYGYGNNLGFGSNVSLGYAVEAWFKTTTLTGNHWIAFIGNIGAPSGLGIMLNGTDVVINKAGAGYFAPAAVAANVWNHVGLVVDSGNATLYLNGTSTGTVAFTNALGPNFIIGADDNHSQSLRFLGGIDDVRMLSFNAGTFSTSMLSYTAVPEPAAFAALAGVTALGLAMVRRRNVVI
jgi:hypothetical protein